ncbi:MAG: LysE family translocator [Halofilum sp. (in: g-proteobacteria)]|nr:LysE family translocator [Halofilum sp. (in: g-proteobacteria)]
MNAGTWLSVAAICALGAASPGPSLAVVLRHAVAGSRARGIACALAHAAGVGLYALLTVLGLAAVMARRPELYRLVAGAGAIYLAWLGFKLLRAPVTDPAAPPRATAGAMLAAARDGFVIALLNPKIALFFLALFSQFVGPEPAAAEVAILAGTATGIDAAWYVAVASVMSGGGLRGRLHRYAGTLARLMGVALLVVAASTLVSLGT